MFDNFPADEARDLMMLAFKGGSPSKNMGFAPQPVASSSASAEPKNPTSLAQPCPPRPTQTIVSACIDHRGTPEHPARTCTLAAKEGEVCIWNRYRISHLSSIRQDDSVSSFQLFLCGFAAGTCAKAVCHPLDVVKKRFQVEH